MKTTANRVFKSTKGFTLIELLVVIGILAILLSIVLIAINPARQFGQANDTKRQSAVTQVLNAVGAYAADNKGQLPPAIVALAADTPTEIASGNGNADLCTVLVPTYIPALPSDPSLNTADITVSGTPAVCPASYDTGYKISRDANNRVTVSAPNADVTTPIQITR
jgi:prepilin-type N-terminal cleavage/methylation domain-containing protein